MQKKILLVFAVCCLFAAFSEAGLVKGSCPAGGSKSYTFTPSYSGIALFALIYDNVNSDLDIRLAVKDDSGDLVGVAFSESSLKNYENLQIGVVGQTQYTVFVSSYKGSSPYRMDFDGTFTTASSGGSGQAAAVNIPGLREIPLDAAAVRFLQKSDKLTREIKAKQ